MSTVELGLGSGLSLRPQHKPGWDLWCGAEQGFHSSCTWASCPCTAISRPISHSTSVPKNSVRVYLLCVVYLLCDLRHISFLRCPWPGVMLGKKPLNYFYCPCQPVSTSVNWGSPLLASFLSVISYFPGKTPDWNCLSFVFPSPPCSLPIIVGALSLLVWFHYLSLVNYLPSI